MDAFRFNWQLIVLLMVSGQALLFATVLLLQRRGNRKANVTLGLLVLLLLWHHLDFIVNTSFWYQVFPHFYTPNYVSWYLLGPLLYLYVRFVSQPDYRPGTLLKISFLPACVAFVNYIGLYTMSAPLKTELIRRSVIRNLPGDSTLFEPLIPATWIFAGQLPLLALFLLLSIRVLRVSNRTSKLAGKTHTALRSKWLYCVLASFTLAVMVSGFYFRAIWVSPILPLQTSIYFYIAPLTLLLLILETGAFLVPEVYAGEATLLGRGEKYINSRLDDDEAARILARLRALMETQKPYLDSNLRINSLSRELNIPVNHLSQAINQQLNKNFAEFVNTYRVEEAKRLLQMSVESGANLLTIALEVGFNNKTSFLNAFKKHLFMSPSKYRKSLQPQK